LREVWALEDGRRAAVGLKFYQRAMEGDEIPSRRLFAKTSEKACNIGRRQHVPSICTQAQESQVELHFSVPKF